MMPSKMTHDSPIRYPVPTIKSFPVAWEAECDCGATSGTMSAGDLRTWRREHRKTHREGRAF